MEGTQATPEEDSLCDYGSRYLLRQLEAMRKEIPGLQARGDIEHVHRMRVATRRFRSALPLFFLCMPERRMRRWRRRLLGVARALGEARDADIQIAYLEEYLAGARGKGTGRFRERLPAEIRREAHPAEVRPGLDRFLSLLWRVRYAAGRLGGRIKRYLDLRRGPAGQFPGEGDEGSRSHAGQDPIPGIEYLLLRHRQARDLLQEGIESAIAELEEEGILGRMERRLEGARLRPGPVSTREEAFAAAFASISLRIDALLSYGDALADPGRIEEHHAMRIAGKRLRYALEAWNDIYGGTLGDGIDTLKKIQDLLGDLHDCDVWIGSIPGFLRDEEERSRAFFGDDRHFTGILPGIRAVMEDRRQERVHLHETCLTFWRDLSFHGYWERLREKALGPLIQPSPDGVFRIGLMSGIHGDAEALAMVISDGRAQGADLFLNAGDTLGRGNGASQVVDLIRRRGVVSVLGDRDRETLGKRDPAGRRHPGMPPGSNGRMEDSRR